MQAIAKFDKSNIQRISNQNIYRFKNGKQLVKIGNEKIAKYLHNQGLELKFHLISKDKQVWYFYMID